MTREQLEKLHDEAVAYATKVKLEHGEHNDVAAMLVYQKENI